MSVPDLATWCASLADGFGGLRLAYTWAFLEAIILPLPPEILLIPLALAAPERGVTLAVAAVCGSLSGGLVSFLTGWRWNERVVAILKRLPGVNPDRVLWASLMVRRLGSRFIAVSPWLVLPYKITSVVSGTLHLTWWRYLLAGAVGRGTRLLSIAWVAAMLGARCAVCVQTHAIAAVLLTYAAVGAGVWLIQRWLLQCVGRW